VKLLVGEELKAIFIEDESSEKGEETTPGQTPAPSQFGARDKIAPANKPALVNNSAFKNEKPGVKAKLPAKAAATRETTFRIRWR
jgi:hypothetical protein